MMTKRFAYTNYSHNLDAENFQILYEQYKDALKIIKNLKKENEQLKKEKDYYKRELQKDLVCQAIIDGRKKND